MTAASPVTNPWPCQLPADRLTLPDLVAGTYLPLFALFAFKNLKETELQNKKHALL
jgi:hypothetical protein